MKDVLRNDEGTGNSGHLVVLPSSITCGLQYMHEQTEDAFCDVCKYSHPDLFVTFTTNPEWTEILQEFHQSHSSHNRHDLVAWVVLFEIEKINVDLLVLLTVYGPLQFKYTHRQINYIKIHTKNEILMCEVASKSYCIHILKIVNITGVPLITVLFHFLTKSSM